MNNTTVMSNVGATIAVAELKYDLLLRCNTLYIKYNIQPQLNCKFEFFYRNATGETIIDHGKKYSGTLKFNCERGQVNVGVRLLNYPKKTPFVVKEFVVQSDVRQGITRSTFTSDPKLTLLKNTVDIIGNTTDKSNKSNNNKILIGDDMGDCDEIYARLKILFPYVTFVYSDITNDCRMILNLSNVANVDTDKITNNDICVISNNYDNTPFEMFTTKWDTVEDIIGKIQKWVASGFDNLMSKCANILFVSTGSESCFNVGDLTNYYENNGKKTYGLVINDVANNFNNLTNISVVSTTKKIQTKLANSETMKESQFELLLENVLPIQKIKEYFDNKVDLVIVNNKTNIDILKKYFDCEIWCLIENEKCENLVTAKANKVFVTNHTKPRNNIFYCDLFKKIQNCIKSDCVVSVVSSIFVGTELNNLDKLCINSYVKNGWVFNLYLYDRDSDPKINGCNIIDANTIMDAEVFKTNPEKFKYHVLYKTGGMWTSMNMVWLRDVQIKSDYMFLTEPDLSEERIFDDVLFDDLIKCPKGSNMVKKCCDESMELRDALECFNMNQYKVDANKYMPISNSSQHLLNSNKGINIDNKCFSLKVNPKLMNINKLALDTTWLKLMSKYVYTLSIFCCATEPIANSYPIYESISSFLNLADEIVVVYGREEPESEKVLKSISDKIKICKTNAWPIDWTYSVMTNHFNIGMNVCKGDLVFKIDIDYICRCDDLKNPVAMREYLFSHIDTHHIIQMPRINYLAEGYYVFCKNMGPYIINTRLLKRDNKKYYIGVVGYANTICVDDNHNEIIVDNYDYAVVNYDCSFMNVNQYLEKQNKWFMAYFKQFGSLERFGITAEDIQNKDKLLKFCMSRMFARRTRHFVREGYDLNPTIIKERIKNLTDDQFGKSYFKMEDFKNVIKMYKMATNEFAKK